jgi:hypothetical protein
MSVQNTAVTQTLLEHVLASNNTHTFQITLAKQIKSRLRAAFLFNMPFRLSNIVRVIKSRRKRWAGHVARIGERRGVYRVLVGKPEGK